MPLLIAAASLLVFVGSGVLLAQRVRSYNVEHPRAIFYAIRIDDFAFDFAGRRAIVTPELDAAGEGQLTLTYGDAEGAAKVVMPVQVPQPIELPGLDRFLDWMHVYYVAENSQRLAIPAFRERVDRGDEPVRCVVVERRVDPGVAEKSRFDLAVDEDDWGWGEVMRHRWTFAFHELMPDGTIQTHELRMPESGASFYRRQVRAHQAGEPAPQRAADELKEGSWEWDIALRTMPRPPAITMENQGLLAAGWTLPVTSAAALAAIVSLAFAFAPPRTKAAPTIGADAEAAG